MAYTRPRLTVSVKDCNCVECGEVIKKGATCVVVPKEKKVHCYECGKKHLKS